MRIVLTGGGTGGHFYPLIAVVEALEDIAAERTLLEPELFYIGPPAFDKISLTEHDIHWLPSPAGKTRRYLSILNVLDVFKTFFGIIKSIGILFKVYPDVVFSTGGYSAFPTLWAARLLRIPVVIYDADAHPGRVSKWSSKFAHSIAVAHPDAALGFPESVRGKIARTGHPIRKEIESPAKEGGHQLLKLDASIPTIFIVGGSQGAQAINEVVLNALPTLLQKYNIIHQTGQSNFKDVGDIASVVLKDSPYASRYKPFGLLNALTLRLTAGIASLVIARAGSGTIFEIASWGVPSILVPIPEYISHDQTENAFSYARSGAAIVVEQKNLSPHLLVAEIDRIIADAALRAKMSGAAKEFARPEAARKIADLLMKIALEHEPV